MLIFFSFCPLQYFRGYSLRAERTAGIVHSSVGNETTELIAEYNMFHNGTMPYFYIVYLHNTCTIIIKSLYKDSYYIIHNEKNDKNNYV